MRRCVAVLGGGLTGAAVVAALLEGGHRVRVWGATPSWYLSAFADAGVLTAASAHQAMEGAEVVVLAFADRTEQDAFRAAGSGLPVPATVLSVRLPGDHDGGGSSWWPGEAEIDHLDCVLLGNLADLGTERVVVLVSGAPALAERHRPLLGSLGVVIPVGGPAASARRTEIALVGLWYDVSVAVLRGLANIDRSARPVLELELRAILAQLPSVINSVDTGDPVRTDIGLALHARALRTVIATRSGPPTGELEQAARQIDLLMAGDADPRSPLTRIAQSLRWPDDTPAPDTPAPDTPAPDTPAPDTPSRTP